MIIEKILGKIQDFDTAGKHIEYVDIDWYEAYKKVHRKVTDKGRELGIRLDDSVFKTGLVTGHVLYEDASTLIVVNTPACEAILVTIDKDHPHQVAKACYEIGNRHAPLFWGPESMTFVTPYNEPMLKMLNELHGVTAEKKVLQFDFDHQISATVSSHHH